MTPPSVCGFRRGAGHAVSPPTSRSQWPPFLPNSVFPAKNRSLHFSGFLHFLRKPGKVQAAIFFVGVGRGRAAGTVGSWINQRRVSFTPTHSALPQPGAMQYPLSLRAPGPALREVNLACLRVGAGRWALGAWGPAVSNSLRGPCKHASAFRGHQAPHLSSRHKKVPFL
jgi:hypothetical protein